MATGKYSSTKLSRVMKVLICASQDKKEGTVLVSISPLILNTALMGNFIMNASQINWNLFYIVWFLLAKLLQTLTKSQKICHLFCLEAQVFAMIAYLIRQQCLLFIQILRHIQCIMWFFNESKNRSSMKFIN